MKFNQEDFNKSTVSLFKSDEGKAWLGMAKHHPQIKYWFAAAVSGQGQEGSVLYWDGVKTPFRMIDCILDNSK